MESHFEDHPWGQWKFLHTPSDIWQQRNCSDCFKKMFCTESKSQSPNYSTRNLRISSHIHSLIVSSGARVSRFSKKQTEHQSCLQDFLGLTSMLRDALFHFEPWLKLPRLSCQHDSAAAPTPSAHTELLTLVQSLQLITDIPRNFMYEKGTKHSLCITSRSVTNTITSVTSEDGKKNANLINLTINY